MSSESAGRVSRGGRRKGTAPPGNGIMRKKAASSTLDPSMLRTHEGSSPRAAMAEPAASTNTAIASRRMRRLDTLLRDELRKDFNLHLPGADVVGNIFGGDRQFVRTRNGLFGNEQLAGIGACSRIPAEFNRCRTIQPRYQRPRALRRVNLQVDRLPALEAFVVELHLDHRRLAGNHERFRLTIRSAELVAQDEAHGVGPILHVSGSKKAGLPNIFRREVTQRLHQSKRKQRDNRRDRWVGSDAKYGVARPNDAWTQQRARHSQERSVGSNELVLARQADD